MQCVKNKILTRETSGIYSNRVVLPLKKYFTNTKPQRGYCGKYQQHHRKNVQGLAKIHFKHFLYPLMVFFLTCCTAWVIRVSYKDSERLFLKGQTEQARTKYPLWSTYPCMLHDCKRNGYHYLLYCPCYLFGATKQNPVNLLQSYNKFLPFFIHSFIHSYIHSYMHHL